jgi:hypothetical protein
MKSLKVANITIAIMSIVFAIGFVISDLTGNTPFIMAWYGKVAIAVWGIISCCYLVYVIYQSTVRNRSK